MDQAEDQAGSVHVGVQPAGRLQGSAGGRSASSESRRGDSGGKGTVSECQEDRGPTRGRNARAAVRLSRKARFLNQGCSIPCEPGQGLRLCLIFISGESVGK